MGQLGRRVLMEALRYLFSMAFIIGFLSLCYYFDYF